MEEQEKKRRERKRLLAEKAQSSDSPELVQSPQPTETSPNLPEADQPEAFHLLGSKKSMVLLKI